MSNVGLFIFTIVGIFSQAQNIENDTIIVENKTEILTTKKPKRIEEVVADVERVNAIKIPRVNTPIKAGLYSAVLPGMGQYYNRKYWKIPVVWGLIGTSVGITLYQDKQYQRYRNAFVLELNGQPNEFSSLGISNLKEALGRQQDTMKRYRDYWIAITGIVYILNIIDAVVDAHLSEGRKDPDLALSPTMIYQPEQAFVASGLQLKFRF